MNADLKFCTDYTMETWFWILGWLLSILAIAGNGLTVQLVISQRRLRTKTIVSLAVADFCAGAFVVASLPSVTSEVAATGLDPMLPGGI